MRLLQMLAADAIPEQTAIPKTGKPMVRFKNMPACQMNPDNIPHVV
jgi:hypothetical protein